MTRLRPFWQAYRFPILASLTLRAGIGLWMGFLWIFLDPYFPLTGEALTQTYQQLSPQPTLAGRALIDVWLRWDAVHYMNIAHQGYEGVGMADMNYLPLYPYLTRFVTPLLGGIEPLAGLLLSTLFTVLASVVFYQLVVDIFASMTLARATVLAWLFYPTSIFLFAPFTEGLFSFLALGCLLALQRKKWLLAGFCACLAAATRTQGLLLIPVLLLAGWQEKIWRSAARWRFLQGLLLSPLGYVLYLAWRAGRGVPLLITDSYLQYSQATVWDPFSNLAAGLKSALETGYWDVWAEVLTSLLFAALIVWMLTHEPFRRHSILITYSVLTWCFVLMKHNLAASPIQSANRYMLGIFPAFIVLASLVQMLPVRGQKAILLVSMALIMVIAWLYAMWAFIG